MSGGDIAVLVRRLGPVHRGAWLRLGAWSALRWLPLALWPAVVAGVVEVGSGRGSGDPGAQLAMLLGLALACILAFAGADMRYARAAAGLRRDVTGSLRRGLARGLFQKPLSWHLSADGAQQDRLLGLAGELGDAPERLTDALLAALLAVGAAVVFLAVVAPPLLLALLVACPLAAAGVLLLARRLTRAAQAHLAVRARLAEEVSESLAMLPVAQAHAVEPEQLARIDAAVAAEGESAARIDRRRHAVSTASVSAFRLLEAGLVGYAAWLAAADVVPAGAVAALALWFLQIGGSLHAVAIALGCAGADRVRLEALADAAGSASAAVESPPAVTLAGELRLNAVRFAYPGRGSPAIDGIDLVVPAGGSLAVVGPSGSGKSTLLHLLLGLLDPDQGGVELDGRDWRTLDRRALRRQVGVVLQEPRCFAGTVRENLVHGGVRADDAGLVRALESACLAEEIRALPGGLDARLGPGGRGLSVGQRQRLCIARALVRDPRLLVLDEPTSALDPLNQGLVLEAVRNAMRGRTTVIATHALPLVMAADRVVVLSGGRAAEQGPPQVLAAAGRHFARQLHALELPCVPC